MTLDAELLKILVCPNDRGDRLPRSRAGDRLSHVRLPVSRPGRDPGDRRGRPGAPADEGRLLSDREAIRRHDPGGMLDAIAGLGRRRDGYGADSPRPACRIWPTCAASWCAAWADRRSRATCCGRCSAGGGVPVEVNRGRSCRSTPVARARDRVVVLGEHRGDPRRVPRATKRGCRGIVVTSGGLIATEAQEAGVPVVRVPVGSSRAPPRVARLHDARRAGSRGAAAAPRARRGRGRERGRRAGRVVRPRLAGRGEPRDPAGGGDR